MAIPAAGPSARASSRGCFRCRSTTQRSTAAARGSDAIRVPRRQHYRHQGAARGAGAGRRPQQQEGARHQKEGVQGFGSRGGERPQQQRGEGCDRQEEQGAGATAPLEREASAQGDGGRAQQPGRESPPLDPGAHQLLSKAVDVGQQRRLEEREVAIREFALQDEACGVEVPALVVVQASGSDEMEGRHQPGGEEAGRRCDEGQTPAIPRILTAFGATASHVLASESSRAARGRR